MPYLRILDDKVKKPHENPSIGIVLCKEANRSFVEYVMQDYDKPMGVATYTTTKEMPEMLKDTLPDMDELKKLLWLGIVVSLQLQSSHVIDGAI